MKKNKILWLVSLSLIIIVAARLYSSFFAVTYHDFDRLEGKGTHFWKKFSENDLSDLTRFKKLFLKNYPKIIRADGEYKIPKVLHYIWLGPKDFPKESIAFVESWVKYHPDWKIVLWTEDMQRALPHPMIEKRDIKELSSTTLYPLLDKTDNYGEKSDILRYEILSKEGGVYVDHDIECFHSMDNLARSVDFFAGLEPPHVNQGIDTRIFPCNAIIGCRKGHPILDKTIAYVSSRWNELEKKFQGNDAESRTLKVFHRTFHSFTLGVKDSMDEEGNTDILLPASFFYSEALENKNEVLRWKKRGLVFTQHHCAGVWKPKDEKSLLVAKMNREHDKRIRLEKRYMALKGMLYFSLALSGGLLFLLVKKRRKSVCGL